MQYCLEFSTTCEFEMNVLTESHQNAFEIMHTHFNKLVTIFLYDIIDNRYLGVLIDHYSCHLSKEQIIDMFVNQLDIPMTLLSCELTTYKHIFDIINHSKYQKSNVFNSFLEINRDDFIRHSTLRLVEQHIIQKDVLEKTELIEYAKPFENLKEQMLGSSTTRFMGHSYHYVITGKNNREIKDVTEVLTQYLYQSNRLLHPIINKINFNATRFIFRNIEFIDIMECAYGSVLLIDLNNIDEEDITQRMLMTFCNEIHHAFCELSPKILLIFWIEDDKNFIFRDFISVFNNFRFIKIDPCLLDYHNATTLLKKLVLQENLDFNHFTDVLNPEEPFFNTTDVKDLFLKRYIWVLENQYYPLPNLDLLFKITEKRLVSNHALSSLNELIGLDNIKLQVEKLLNVSLWIKRFKDLNIPIEQFSKHMVFMGNPGTAKTTVARLIGQLFKQHGLLSSGHFLEVSRQDIIGEYVGHTAVKVHQLIQKALGGVLFIDEAYSLHEDNRSTFVPEALGVLMAEMENHRDDLIIIFAGYPKEMDKLLDMNPGFRSRIGFQLTFHDYKKDELKKMFIKIIHDKGFLLSESAIEIIDDFILHFESKANFGQGRAIRNLVEQVIIEHLFQLSDDDVDLTTDELRTIQIDSIKKVWCLENAEYLEKRINYS